ncbi:tryptophan tryptophylquinone biosynthesis enzyme MauG [Rhodoferax lacus]|uniref:Tryptophan tryptophylquinone biosynthesis enzyme MauG n=1 Tax=Rhodoferax lacus TaxID=2184758 RepID=A0A3E1RE64_9BURK|nr:cytochrome c peroxidase [Rhodoferax lacus]RFO97654.1 tryptophan tryptophylquinone biosynthesis enzyme MauG [Rhodoferax lacus]
MKKTSTCIAITLLASLGLHTAQAEVTFKAGDPSLAEFLLGAVPHPADNQPTTARVELGQKLFFDPRMSGDGNMSCATCHNPAMGWSDGLPTARGVKSSVLGRASPTIFNTAYNGIQMWDGRKKSLEDQAMGPMQANVEMNMDIGKLFQWIGNSAGYKVLFARAYPGEPINESTLSRAIASFERTVVSQDSPFDRWVRGDAKALGPQQVEGFKVFLGKGNCVACHSGPNFTDNGFHNLGLASWGMAEPDMGRYAQKPVNAMKGAFKTPTVREVARTAPYFHDGSAKTLMDVVEHYDRGGDVKTNLSPNIKPLGLSLAEKQALVAFLESLSSPFLTVTVPELPAR